MGQLIALRNCGYSPDGLIRSLHRTLAIVREKFISNYGNSGVVAGSLKHAFELNAFPEWN